MGLLAAIGGVYAALCLGLFLAQDRLIFYPDPDVAATPAAVGLAFEDAWLEAGPGERVHAWWVPAGPHAPAVLFLHGNAGNVSHRLETLRVLHRAGLAVLIVDYPGYGRSSGRPSEAGTYRAAEAAWRHLRSGRGLEADRIVVHGRSLGAAVAVWLASRHRPGALVVESGFTSVPDLAAEIYPLFPVRWLARVRYPSRRRLAAVAAPVLVAHAPADEVIPYRHGRELFAAARAPKRFLRLDGGHNDGFLATGERYREALRRFVSDALGGRAIGVEDGAPGAAAGDHDAALPLARDLP